MLLAVQWPYENRSVFDVYDISTYMFDDETEEILHDLSVHTCTDEEIEEASNQENQWGRNNWGKNNIDVPISEFVRLCMDHENMVLSGNA